MGLKSATYLCRMHNKMFKSSYCVFIGSTFKNKVNHNDFQEYMLSLNDAPNYST